MRIRDATSRAHELVIQIRKIKDETKDRAGAVIKSKLDEVERHLYQVKNRSPRDTLNYPIKLNNQLAVLQRLVDMGEARPTDQDYAVFDELTQRLNQILDRLKQIVAESLGK